MKRRGAMALLVLVGIAQGLAPMHAGARTLASVPRAASHLRSGLTQSHQITASSHREFDLGKTALAAGNYPSAVNHFKRSIALNQVVVESYDGLGTAYFGQRSFTKAFQAFRSASDLSARTPAYAYKAALAALYADEPHPAVTYASRYVSLRPGDYNGHHLRFLAYNGALMRKPMVADAQAEVRLEPRNPASYNDLGIALSQNQKYPGAISAYNHAIALNPRNYSYYINRAEDENLNHEQAAALRDLRTARRLAPDAHTRHLIDQSIASLTRAMRHHK